MTDTAHRVAATRSILAKRGWVGEVLRKVDALNSAEATRSSLMKLFRSAVDLHVTSLSKGMDPPRTEDGESRPLVLAITALQTILRNEKGERRYE
jgi:hypothetical protein